MEKRTFSQPEFSFVRNTGALSPEEIARLSDSELERYLLDTGFWQNAKRYCASPDFLLREIAGESILVPVNDSGVMTNCMFSLNETCLYLWKQFQKPHTVDDVVIQAKREYRAAGERIERDIRDFVAEYLSAGLLKEEA
ncbi:MAG: PqqD family protein [Clostridiales bacterium]|nr:PqqD family protein [Clostridiales bacterium]